MAETITNGQSAALGKSVVLPPVGNCWVNTAFPAATSPANQNYVSASKTKRLLLYSAGLAVLAATIVLIGAIAWRDPVTKDETQVSAIRRALVSAKSSYAIGTPTFDATRKGMPLVKLFFPGGGDIHDADNALKQLAEMKALGELEELSIYEPSRALIETMTDEGMSALKEAKKLRTLELSGTRITGAGLVHLKKLTNLETLVLSSTWVSDVGLAQLTTLTQLKKLDLSDTPITDAGLVNLKGMTQLKYLRLSDTPITDAGLVNLNGMTQLTYLSLSRNFGGFGPRKSPGPHSKSPGPHISGRAFSTLSGLAGLEHLHLFGQDKIDVADIIGFTQLRTLGMSEIIELDDERLALISKLKNLEELHGFGWRSVSGAGIARLCGLKEMRELDLTMCPNLTDNDLSNLKNLSKLRSLHLPHTTSAAGRDNLRLALPNTKIRP